jgi:SecD/SecF fusion protein
MQRSIDLMQERVNSLGVAEAEINQAGSDQIEVNLPGVKNAARAEAQVGSTAQLFFYDWEGTSSTTSARPTRTTRSGQPIQGSTGGQQASKCRGDGPGRPVRGGARTRRRPPPSRASTLRQGPQAPSAGRQTFGCQERRWTR